MRPSQPPVVPPQYYAYPTAPPGPQEPFLTKKAIFVLLAVSLMLMFIGQIGVGAIRTGGAVGTAMRALYYVGVFIGTGSALAGGLGSPKADANQKLGLLIFAGFLVMALSLGI
jgi:hypothetical protein